jgi:hypothetical protein
MNPKINELNKESQALRERLAAVTELYLQFEQIKFKVERFFNLFAQIEIVRRSSCDIGSLPEDIALIVYVPYINAWYESKPDSRGKTARCRKEFFDLSSTESLEDKYHKYFKTSETLEFQKVTFLRPYDFERKNHEKLYASSRDAKKTNKEGYYFEFELAELDSVIQIPEKLLYPNNLKKKFFSFATDSFENCLLSKTIRF